MGQRRDGACVPPPRTLRNGIARPRGALPVPTVPPRSAPHAPAVRHAGRRRGPEFYFRGQRWRWGRKWLALGSTSGGAWKRWRRLLVGTGRAGGWGAKRGWHRSLAERSRPGSGLGAGAERWDLRCGPAAWLWFLGVRGRLAVPYCAPAAVLRSAASRGRSGAVPVGAVVLRCFAAAAGPPEAAPGPGTGSRLAASSGYGRGGVVGAQLRSHGIPVAPGWERGGLCSQRGGFPCCPSGSSRGTGN